MHAEVIVLETWTISPAQSLQALMMALPRSSEGLPVSYPSLLPGSAF